MQENKISATENIKQRQPRPVTVVFCILFLAIGFTVFFSALWYTVTYGQLGFDSVLFTLTGGLAGTQSGLIASYLLKGLLPSVLCTAVVSFVLFFPFKKQFSARFFGKNSVLYPFCRAVKITVSLVLALSLTVVGAFLVELPQYIFNETSYSTIFEDKYIDPKTVEIEFPEQKRNLIYITVESLEATFTDKANGGALDYNLIPGITELAKQNTNFSTTAGVGGTIAVGGTTWTAGGMVAHTAGVPLKVPSVLQDNTYGKNGFLSGATTLIDILRDNGYYQAFMLGSDSHFANTNVYYTQHGVNKICDYYTARNEGVIAKDYQVWWGYEDKILYSYAKQELEKISKQEKPFAFSLRTADTHHIDGYVCTECEKQYDEQYENVFSCADRQLTEFISWVTQQPFYENTTIIITGDHPTMDYAYIERNVAAEYDRTVLNCIINPAVTTENTKNRQCTSVDMFPTTLAAMGCKIEGERLGLGTNLFSATPTLAEEMGRVNFDAEISKSSKYYNNKIMN